MILYAMISTKSSARYTPIALNSLYDCTSFSSDDHCLLIDNDGDGNDYHSWQSRGLVVARNTSPQGFAANVNQMLKHADNLGADLFCLNNDLVLTPAWTAPLFDAPKEAIISPISNRELNYTTDLINCSTEMRLEDYLGREEALQTLAVIHAKHYQGLLRVIAVPFFCVLIPRDVYVRVGELDESFGRGGGEDYDYCLRAYLKGFNIFYARSSYVLHFGGKSSWSGVESAREQQEREQAFFSHFEKKWGQALTKLLLREEQQIVLGREDLKAAVERGDLRQVIESLRVR